MEAAGSGGDGDSPSDERRKTKRQMKTPFQLETLEKSYSLEKYPAEARRVELSEKLGLTDRQLQMWFCHRRLKDKKDAALIKSGQTKAVMDSNGDEHMVGEPGFDQGSESSSSEFDNGDDDDDDDDVQMVDGSRELSPQCAMRRRVIDCVEEQLGEPLREDGPVLGMEFDKPPPGAFGAPIVMAEQQDQYGLKRKLNQQHYADPLKALKKAPSGHQFIPDNSSIRYDACRELDSSHLYDLPSDVPSAKTTSFAHRNKRFHRGSVSSPSRDYSSTQMEAIGSAHPVLGPEKKNVNSDMRIADNEVISRIKSKRKSVEPRVESEVEAYNKEIRKETGKQVILREKEVEQIRREMEKQDRERRKEEDRMLREKQRNEEKFLREERREIQRREKFLQRESLRAERTRQKEEHRKEKEAARVKAALEKATARKIARESLELIEDERLEMMELAASSKGLQSIISLDHDTLQNLESFRDLLSPFPPKSVQLKRPFAVQPWIDSEESVGNLFMVWRFCTDFADVLKLWPFTLDEFIQAFHDYDSRLLGEIHIVLLKLIIKDIEDVARTPANVLGTNQYTASSPEGGHPQIVEGAYSWGFDICSWRKHLNPLTWPEIFRQLGLSAGIGPQLKKKNIERPHSRDTDEVDDCENIVTSLRDGSAAENAVAQMQEKRFSLQRKSRHRLTPGTVKFAAYHVLCFEGSKGLTVLEIADKIQKSGLRDLTTSKTPEASISVALSRDTILFERTAPSTYHVRSAFRKESADAESILSAAREKIQKYKNGFLEGENANVAERDDFECDASPEIDDDLGTPSDLNKNGAQYSEVDASSGIRKENFCNDAAQNQCVEHNSAGDTEIDESNHGEAWIQGLTEGEYSDLSVEERLNALVALVSIANEGNSVRAILEDRLDAANALKKQMWAAAQLDKRRWKEEGLSKFQCSASGIVVEKKPTSLVAEACPSPLAVGHYRKETSHITTVQEESFTKADNIQDPINTLSTERSLVINGTSTSQIADAVQQNGHAYDRSCAQMKSYIGHRAEELYVYRSLPLGQDRRRNHYWQFVASASCHDPGSGRIFMESPDGHWKLINCEEAFDALMMSLDTRGIRESHLHIMLQKIEMPFKENVRRKLSCANISGKDATELAFSPANSNSPGSMVCGSDTMEPSSSFKIELGRSDSEKKSALRRYHDFQTWMWQECFSSSTLRAISHGRRRCRPLLGVCNFCRNCYISEDDRCPSCYEIFGTFNDHSKVSKEVIQSEDQRKIDSNNIDLSHPLRMRLARALLTFVEVSVPSEALKSSWVENYRKIWGIELHNSSSIQDFLQCLTQFEGFIKRGWLSENYETTDELFGSCPPTGIASYDSGSKCQLPWIPQTSAAVALRLLELDASISYTQNLKVEACNDKETEDLIVKEEDADGSKNTEDEDEQVDHRRRRGSGPTVAAKRQKVRDYGNIQHTQEHRNGWGRRTPRSRTRRRSPEKRSVVVEEEIVLRPTEKHESVGEESVEWWLSDDDADADEQDDDSISSRTSDDDGDGDDLENRDMNIDREEDEEEGTDSGDDDCSD